jgi:hypothetical protein
MVNPGVPVEAFLEQARGPIVESWPFADLAPDRGYQTAIGYGRNPQDGIAVGRVVSADAGVVEFKVHQSDIFRAGGDRLQFAYSEGQEEIVAAWQRVVGVAMATQVEVDRRGASALMDGGPALPARFIPRNILAITPPLTHPAHADALTLMHRRGDYIQGRVAGEGIAAASDSPMQIKTPDSDAPVTVYRSSGPRVLSPDGRPLIHAHPQDLIRVEIDSRIVPHHYRAGAVLYHLGHGALHQVG